MTRWLASVVSLGLVACTGRAPSGLGPDVDPIDALTDGGSAAADGGDAGAPALDAGGGSDATAPDAVAELEDAAPFTGPARLSETGLYRDLATRALADGVRPYGVRYPLWSDGTEKARYLLLPPGTTIDTSDQDAWRFPAGTKVWKDFRAGGRLIETRLLEKVPDGDQAWRVVAYLWADDERDAFAAPDGQSNARGTGHDVPSRDDCLKCHRGVADTVIGVSAFQLEADTMAAWASEGVFTSTTSTTTRALVPPGEGVVRDTLGYFHANCGHCHNALHPIGRFVPLRLRLTALSAAPGPPEDAPAYLTAVGVAARHRIPGYTTIVAPGAPDQSQLYRRMSVRTLEQMPPVATETADRAGLALVREWIGGLP